MEIKINYPENECYLDNLAFIKSFFIKKTIENMDVTNEEKKEIYNKILEFLKEQ